MDKAQRCIFCGGGGGPFEHAAYRVASTQDGRTYLGWLCRACGRQHGSHDRFAAAMTALDPDAWLVAHPGTPLEMHYRVGGARDDLAPPVDRRREDALGNRATP